MDVKVKICGLTCLDDAQVAVQAGADLLGFIFYPKSPRCVSMETVRGIVASPVVRGSQVRTVGVFVDAQPEEVIRTLDFCRLDLAQLHGAGQAGNEVLSGRSYLALQPRSMEEAWSMADKAAMPLASQVKGVPAFLLDSYHPSLHGGTGKTGDWAVAAALARRYSFLLAGGLNPQNAAEAIRQVHPWGVDVSSGVEASPGKKDHNALRAFIVAVHQTKGE